MEAHIPSMQQVPELPRETLLSLHVDVHIFQDSEYYPLLVKAPEPSRTLFFFFFKRDKYLFKKIQETMDGLSWAVVYDRKFSLRPDYEGLCILHLVKVSVEFYRQGKNVIKCIFS